MKISFAKTLFASSLVLLLTACGDSTFDKKTAKQLYQEGASQLYSAKAQYNFNADLKIAGEEINPMLANLKVRVNGAFDNAKGQLELVPEFKAAMIQGRLPLQLNLKSQQLLLDPTDLVAAIQMFVPAGTSVLNRYAGKYIRFQPKNFSLDTEQKQQLNEVLGMVDTGISVLMDVQDESIASLPDKHFKKLELDDYAKNNQARAVIHFSMTAEESMQHSQKMAQAILKRIENEEKFAEFKDEFATTINTALSENLGESVDTTLYINEKGQITHMKGLGQVDVEGEKVKFQMLINLTNYGKATFSMQPDSSQIIDFNEDEIVRLQQAAAASGLQ